RLRPRWDYRFPACASACERCARRWPSWGAFEMTKRTTIPTLFLERLALGELSPQEREAAMARIDADPEARERLAAIIRSNEEVLAAYPPERVRAEIERRSARERSVERPRVRWLMLVAPVLGAAAVVLVFALRQPPPDTERLKGLSPQVLVFQQQGGARQVEALQNGAIVHPHDLIQSGYFAAGRRFGVLLSIDGAGGVTLHFPDAPKEPTRLGKGKVLLPRAFELDDAPDFERFIFVTSNEPLDAAAVLGTARQLAKDHDAASSRSLPLGTSVEQSSILLLKKERRP